jgi:hypothetical protein
VPEFQCGGGVAQKRLTVIVYGSDRNLWRGGALQIRVADVFASGGPRALYTGQTAVSTLDLELDLPFDSGQVYGITFSAPRQRPAWQLVRRQDFIRVREQVEGDDLVLRLMLVPDKPGTSDLATAFGRLQQGASPFASPRAGVDAATFAALGSPARMAMLNVEAKLRETFVDGAPILSFVRGVSHVAVDRVFLFFDAALKARMPRSIDFADAPGHGAPPQYPELPAHPNSWKHTRFAEGNVQLSFAAEPMALPRGDATGLVHSADVDIDLGRGIAHAAEWLDNNVIRRGHKTDQSLVYGLLFAQGILPLYTLDPVPAATDRAMPFTLARVAPERKRPSRRPAATKRAASKRAATKRATRRRATSRRAATKRAASTPEVRAGRKAGPPPNRRTRGKTPR